MKLIKKSFAKTLCCILLGVLLASTSASAKTGTCTASTLCVRTGPSTGYQVINYMRYGDKAPITYNCGNGWYEIYLNGRVGYVCGTYIYADNTSYNTWAGSGANVYSGSSGTYTAPAASYSTQTTYTAPAQTTTYTAPASTKKYLGTFKLTAYCGCARCCGTANQPTASGLYPTAGHTVAMGGVPFGTKLLINGVTYTVEDRGTPYGTVDIYFNTHQEALNFGLQVADVYQVD